MARTGPHSSAHKQSTRPCQLFQLSPPVMTVAFLCEPSDSASKIASRSTSAGFHQLSAACSAQLCSVSHVVTDADKDHGNCLTRRRIPPLVRPTGTQPLPAMPTTWYSQLGPTWRWCLHLLCSSEFGGNVPSSLQPQQALLQGLWLSICS